MGKIVGFAGGAPSPSFQKGKEMSAIAIQMWYSLVNGKRCDIILFLTRNLKKKKKKNSGRRK